MKYGCIVVQFLCFIQLLHAQSSNITGKWILDRVVYKDGQRLEINNDHHTGTNLLITKEVHHLMLYTYLKDPEEKKLYDLLGTGDEHYYQNQFAEAVKAYSDITKLPIRNNRYKLTIKQAMIRLGIAYLAPTAWFVSHETLLLFK